MSAHAPHQNADMDDADSDHEDAMLDPTEADEEIASDEDAPMDSDDDEENMQEIQLHNDSIAHFDAHKESIFCIAQHPVHPEIIATGGGEGDDEEEIGIGYVFECTPPEAPVLPASYQSNPQPVERASLPPLYKLEGHSGSIGSITYTLPKGQYLCTGGLDGKLCVWQSDPSGRKYRPLAEAAEVEEINWLAPCPHPNYPNTIALGAKDGSVWVYTINAADKTSPLTIVQTFYIHTDACTAGAWSPDGRLLATVSEDASFYAWDVFGEAAAAGVGAAAGSQAVVGLTAQDERFKVEGGLYSVAVSPNGAFAAVGGAEGHVRIVGLPRIGTEASSTGSKGAGARAKAGGGKQAAGSAGQAGQILASLKAQTDDVVTLSFSAPPSTLLAAGSVDGSIVLFDTAHRFAVRRHIPDAHAEEDEEVEKAVVKVEFVRDVPGGEWLLTSCGSDGVVRRWDARGGTAAAAKGLVGEWRGHRGGGEGGLVQGFVQAGGRWIVTAGDDGVALVFDAKI
ncbi:60S ribosomal subunit assembly or modification protein [Coniosporium apollinis]|uniref:60S ribosomal subunit assembly or modification protein n=1 Tax=Coniosporium apollinis TaxID=61459 RepID=A0ABQ9P198_9PEZI|nr:60S ribosomal subunit assembly or modification protein [Coniosporium apollinis]